MVRFPALAIANPADCQLVFVVGQPSQGHTVRFAPEHETCVFGQPIVHFEVVLPTASIIVESGKGIVITSSVADIREVLSSPCVTMRSA